MNRTRPWLISVSSRQPVRGGVLCILSALAILPALAGCTPLKALMLMGAPTNEKMDAECNRLEGKKTLVYVWAPPDIMWDYPKIRLDVAAYVSANLDKNIKKITVIPAVRVESYLEQINALQLDPAELGKNFEAEMVVHISVFKFSIRDPGMAHFYRGRMGGSITVFDLTKQGEPPERIPLRDVNVAVPPDSASGFTNVRPEEIRQSTYDAFAVEVGKKFHEWEQPQG